MGLEELGLEGGEGLSGAALEKLAEQLRENAAAVKAMRQQEGKQRDKDNKLVAILMKFVKGNSNQALVDLIVRLLNENVPASFILAIILLGNDEIQKDLGIVFALPEGFRESQQKLLKTSRQNNNDNEDDDEEEEFYLNIERKVILKMWTESIINASLENPYKIIRTVKDFEGNTKSTAIQLVAFIIRDFFEKKSTLPIDFEQIRFFAEATLKEIFIEIEKRTSQSQLTGETLEPKKEF